MKKIEKNRVSERKKTKMTYDQLLAQEIGFVADVVGFSNSHVNSVYSDSTVVKSPEVVYRGAVYSKNRLISEEYLLNFRRSQADMSMIIGVNNFRLPNVIQSQACRKDAEDPEDLIMLPKFSGLNEPLGPVIRSRRSFRNYSGKSISLEQFSTILFHAQGVTGKLHLRDIPRTVTFESQQDLDLRAAPSGGGLFPISLYLFVMNVKGLDVGAYRYVPEYHALKLVNRLSPDFDVNVLAQFSEMNAQAANAFVCFSYDLYANSRKYGDSGMAYAFIEAGEIAAHIHLATTALGMGACDIGGYNKKNIEELVGLDGVTNHIMHLLIIGNK